MNSPHTSINDKVAIVTGSAHGIGAAIARRYASEGAWVMIADIDGDGARAVATEIQDKGGKAEACAVDIADDSAVQRLFTETLAQWKTVDILVNNASLVTPNLHILEADKAWWDRIVGVNLTGTFHCSWHAARIMARRGSGCIINVSSGGATRAHRCFVSYDAAKGGVEAMSRALALDLGPYGVRVNILTPGAIDTSGLDLDARKLRGQNIPLERVGEPDDLAGAAVFLATDDARYITGQSIVVDGGMLAQQRSATVDICPPSQFPSVEDGAQ